MVRGQTEFQVNLKLGLTPCPSAVRRSRDTDSAETFIKEFQDFEKNGTLPRFMVMSLGEDHTTPKSRS